MHSWSLKTRFSIGVVLLFFLALAAILHVVLDTLQDRFQRLIGQDVALLTETHATLLDRRFEAATQMLQTIAAHTPAAAFDNAGIAHAYIGTQSAGLSVFDLGLYVANKDRILMGVNTTDPLAVQKRLGKLTGAPDADYRARESRQPTFSDPYPSPSCNGCPAVALIIPIFGRDGEHRGFVTGALRLDGNNFLASLKDVRIGQGGYFFMLTRSRTMLMHPDPARIMKIAAKPGQNKIIDKALDDNFEGSGVTVNSTGTKMIVGIRAMKSTGWLLAANFPVAEAEQPFRETRDRVFLLAAVAGLGLLTLAWIVAQRSLAPLSRLTEHVASLTNQVEKTPIDLQVTGEIGTLERAFNEMLAVQERQRRGPAVTSRLKPRILMIYLLAFKRLTPATKRCSVCDSTPRGIMISISWKRPRVAIALSSAAFSSARVWTRTPSPPIPAAIDAKPQSSRLLKPDSGWKVRSISQLALLKSSTMGSQP